MNKTILSYIQIAAGTLIGALAVNLFMVPLALISGGLTGLVLLIHYLMPLPKGMMYFLANVPTMVWLFRLYGWHGLAKQLFGIGAFSFWLWATEMPADFAVTTDPMLATIFAGVLIGLGLGLTMRVGGSTGGFSAVAHLVHHYTGCSKAKFIMATDVIVLGMAALTMPLEMVLYGLVMTFVLMRVVQAVQEGFSTSRCMLIVSEVPDRVGQALLNEAQRGVTRLSGMGEYSGHERPVLMCVVSETEVHKVKRLVMEADPNAFVVITDAREVAGRGFTLDTEVRRIPFWVTQRGA